jgi:hypothetical protein
VLLSIIFPLIGELLQPLLDVPHAVWIEYFVPIRWLQTVPLEKAVQEVGLFGNQNTVCKPTTPKWRFTVERLKEKFPNFDQSGTS